MTSKEALTILKYSYHTRRDTELLSIIEKDLEVLEILKKHLWLSFSSGFQVYCSDTIDLGNEKEFNLLKEWKND